MKSFTHKPAYLIQFFPSYLFPACLSGFVSALAFPGVNFYALAFIGLVPLLVNIEKLNKKERFFAGLLAGFVHYLTLIHWFLTTMHTYGNLNIMIAISALILMCLYFALYFAFFSLIIGSFKYNSLFMPFFAASLWVALEYLRTYLFTGFPWCITGYSQYLNNNFIQIADITGVYGISFFILLINAFAALIVINFKKNNKKVLVSGFYILIVFIAVFSYGISRNNKIDTYTASADYTKIAVVQGNIRQDIKWDAGYVSNTLNKYSVLSEKVSQENPDLIVWPETALPFYYGFSKKLSDKVDVCVRKAKTSFLIGSPAFKREDTKLKYYNRAYMLNKFSVETGKYDKIHLVPFGEYVPLGDYLSFLGKLTAQAGDFTAGEDDTQPLDFGAGDAGILICFEIIFPTLSRNFVKKGADILLTITNDAWFGRSSAAEQHFSMAVFRAIENRRSLARAANTGISGFVSPNGKIYEKSEVFVEGSLVHDLPVLKIKSFYTIFGDVFAFFCSIAIIISFVVNRMLILRLEKKTLD
ncbi:MAG: apolipoprotein N-acyltransferase [Desulfobacteraceae bacterium]|nr:apolipoprotein N-acyltransferase [Desulfobacteraceae bacterium]